MLKRLIVGCLASVVCYPLGFGVGLLLVSTFSSNTHDRGLEAAMTGAFVVGPLFAVIGLGLGVALSPGRSGGDSEPRP